MLKNKKNTHFFVRVLTINDGANYPYTCRCLSPIVDTHTFSTKITLHCCIGRFL